MIRGWPGQYITSLTQSMITLPWWIQIHVSSCLKPGAPRVPPLRAFTASSYPVFPNQEHDSHEDSVRNEPTAHDIVRQTLSQVPSSAIPSECDGTEKHLHPSKDGVRLPNETMSANSPRPKALLVNVQFQVDPKRQLGTYRYEHNPCHLLVCVLFELSASV